MLLGLALRCAENFIFMAAAASAEGVGICALSAIIQLHTSDGKGSEARKEEEQVSPSGQQLMPWNGSRLKRPTEHSQVFAGHEGYLRYRIKARLRGWA